MKIQKQSTITAAQIRAARGLLDWSRETLSETSGISMRTLARIECEDLGARIDTIEAIRKCFVTAGIKFIKNGVVRTAGGTQ